MRPLKLIVSGFGPYCKECEFDFEKLGKSGLYLITGDTGAGKTTIFDAITYALYDEPSGGNRDVSMLRSKYAEISVPTYVELKFEYHNKIYTIHRNPKYIGISKNGKGTRVVDSDATLYYPDGDIVSGKVAVNKKVIEIMGINRNQFSQIAMIAQGDFLKLLFADTNTRIDIFRHIFKTENFDKLQKKLSIQVKEVEEEYKVLKNSIKQYTSGILCDQDCIEYLEVEKAIKDELTIEEVKQLIIKLIEKDTNDEQSIEKDKTNLQVQLDLVKTNINKVTEFNKAKKELELNENELSVEVTSNKQFLLELEDLKQKEPEIKELNEKIAAIKSFIPEYDQLNKNCLLLNENNRFIESNTKLIKSKEESIEASKNEITLLSEQLKTVIKVGEEKVKLEHEINTLNQLIEKLNKLKIDLTSYQKDKKLYKEALEVYKNSYDLKQSLEEEYKIRHKIYLDAQAGILAKDLKENEPCPVCGSLNHPLLASIPENACSKEALESLLKQVNKANKEANRNSEIAGNLKGIYTQKEEMLLEESKVLLEVDSIDHVYDLVQSKLIECEDQLKVLSDKYKEVLDNSKKKEYIENELPEKENTLKLEEEELNKTKETIKIKSAENDVIEKHIKELKTKLSFNSKEEAELEIRKLDKIINEIRTSLETLNNKYNKSNEKIASLNATKKQIEKRISNTMNIDLEKENEVLKQLELKQKQLDQKIKDIHTNLTTNKSILKNIEVNYEKLNKVEKKHSWMNSLSLTANGLLSGKERIKLEAYVLMYYFDEIIACANTRLMMMSEGQYELVRRKEGKGNAQIGLDLDVIDHYNGSYRSVKSLSGGESFKASLALALGLADKIQIAAGGIKLDTMFIDEGFGSLDEESLASAIKALNSLAENNKLVGIISHVNELKQRIDKQIIVSKDRSGGSKAEIVV